MKYNEKSFIEANYDVYKNLKAVAKSNLKIKN